MTALLWLIIAAPAAAVLALTLFNVFAWPRGSNGDDAAAPTHVSILIPARDETATIARSVEAALDNDPLEVVVYDDQSTDGTSELLAAIAARDARLRVVRGEALPDEPHADWATSIRSEVRVAMIALARMVADDAGGVGDHLRAVEAHRRILDLDPYDEAAHVGVIAAFRAMGAHGQAETAQTTYARLMADLGLPLAGSRAG